MPKKACAAPNRRADAVPAVRCLVAASFAALLAASAATEAAQVLYKWVDASGKTQYSDKPPKDFKGELVRIDADEQPVPAEAYKPPRPALKPSAIPRAEPDAASRRREVRGKLESAVASARARLAAARKARDAGEPPQDDERQVIQQRVERGNPAPGSGSMSTGGMLGMGGMLGGARRSNCTTVKSADGRVVTTCPTLVPNDAYYDRLSKLEDDVRAAEADLDKAEQAYRRGAD
jgi:hypothetical protein